MDNLKAKIFIKGKIKLITGLHIGGSSTALDIGGIDNNVIKTARNVPYIPGSSLKGKLRTLYGVSKGYESVEEDDEETSKVFGVSATEEGDRTRIIVRDAFLDEKDFENRKEEFSELELQYTEAKWENTIKRVNSVANPRQLERVPAGVRFKFEFVYNIFNEKDIDNLDILISSMRLLENDYLGASGTRGYGQIEFEDLESVKYKTISVYEGDNKPIEFENKLDIRAAHQNLLNEIKEKVL